VRCDGRARNAKALMGDRAVGVRFECDGGRCRKRRGIAYGVPSGVADGVEARMLVTYAVQRGGSGDSE
jgi:hypothetical protein